MEDSEGLSLPFLTKSTDFPGGVTYQLLQPLTNFKSCHDGTPAESRVVFSCRRLSSSSQQNGDGGEEYIMKVKVQIPTDLEPDPERQAGPSDTTARELKALELFRDQKTQYAPHLVAFKQDVQLENGKLPGGYITYTVMTKMPGKNLYPGWKYWDLQPSDRDQIIPKFLKALRAIYALGVEPIDRGLRNVIWEKETEAW